MAARGVHSLPPGDQAPLRADTARQLLSAVAAGDTAALALAVKVARWLELRLCDVRCANGGTLLDWALQGPPASFPLTLRLLQQEGSLHGLLAHRSAAAGLPILLAAARAGKPGHMKQLLDAGADPDVLDAEGACMAQLAATSGSAACLALAIEACPAQAQHADTQGFGLAHYAAAYGTPALLALTVALGSNPRAAAGDGGLTPRRVAASEQLAALLEEQLEAAGAGSPAAAALFIHLAPEAATALTDFAPNVLRRLLQLAGLQPLAAAGSPPAAEQPTLAAPATPAVAGPRVPAAPSSATSQHAGRSRPFQPAASRSLHGQLAASHSSGEAGFTCSSSTHQPSPADAVEAAEAAARALLEEEEAEKQRKRDDEAKKAANKKAEAQRKAAKAAEEAQRQADAQAAAEAEAANAEEARRERARQQQEAEQHRKEQAFAAMVAKREEEERAAEVAAASAGHMPVVQPRAVQQQAAATAPTQGVPPVPTPAAVAVLPAATPQPTAAPQAIGIGISGVVQRQQASWPDVNVVETDEEVAQIAAALEASRLEASPTAMQLAAGVATSPGAAAQAGGGLSLAGTHIEAGEHGELGSLITAVGHCLWRCTTFRQQVASWPVTFWSADPVLTAVFQLFQQFEAQEAARHANAVEVPADPTQLREALATLPGYDFRVGEMNDGAEVLLCIYEKAMDVAKAQGRFSGIDDTFGLKVHVAVNCGGCRRVTQQNQYTQFFYNTQAAELRELGSEHGSLGTLLAAAEAQHLKTCDTDVGGCGQPNPVTHVLQAAPRVFTLRVAWESHNEAPRDIAATLAAIRETADLGEVYNGVPRGMHCYELRSMVCYHGAHCQALVLVPDAGGWLMFDGAGVSRVGDWQLARHECEAGRIQPSILFYEAA